MSCRWRPGALWIAAALIVFAISLAASAPAAYADAALIGGNTKTPCVYTGHSISILNSFSQMIGRQINCATVYNNNSPTWEKWESPWFINYTDPDSDWSQWATAPGTARQLVITQNLIPAELQGSDWLDAGAAGAYTTYARTLAQNLVNAGLGDSIIRLSPEANGTWYPDSLGSTPDQWALWDQFWRQTVLAMRSVPGAHFRFDWCIVALYRALPLSEIYPGNDVVDVVGIDAYDTGTIGNTADARWNDALTAPMGLQSMVDFAAAQGKPISIPEWGVSPVDQSEGFGDDPTFVNGIAGVIRSAPTAYQSYFYRYGYASQLSPGTQSLAAYQQHFGAQGDSLGIGDPLQSDPAPAPPSPSGVTPNVPGTGPGGTAAKTSSRAAPSKPAKTKTKRPLHMTTRAKAKPRSRSHKGRRSHSYATRKRVNRRLRSTRATRNLRHKL